MVLIICAYTLQMRTLHCFSHWARHLNPMPAVPTHSHYTIRLRVCRVAPPFNIRSSNDVSRRTSDERHSLFHDCRILRSGDIRHKILEVESDE